MKKIIILIAFTLVSLPSLLAQEPDRPQEEGANIITLSPDSGTPVRISPDDNRGFTVAFAGYEIGFSGNEAGHFDLMDHTRRSKDRKRGCGKYKGKLAVFDFGFNNLASVNYKGYSADEHGFMDLKNGKSIYFAFNPFRVSGRLTHDGTLGFTAGLGFVWRNYSFDEPITLAKINGRVHPVDLDPHGLKKSKLTTFAINIPVMLDLNFGKRFFVSGGVYGGIVTGSHTKYKKPKEKSRRTGYAEMLEYGITARAGFRHFYLFGNYGMNDLFKSGKGPEGRTYTVGFSFPF